MKDFIITDTQIEQNNERRKPAKIMAQQRIPLNCVTSTGIVITVFKFKFIELNSNNAKSKT